MSESHEVSYGIKNRELLKFLEQSPSSDVLKKALFEYHDKRLEVLERGVIRLINTIKQIDAALTQTVQELARRDSVIERALMEMRIRDRSSHKGTPVRGVQRDSEYRDDDNEA